MKRDLIKIQKRLVQIEEEVYGLKEILNEYFTEEEQTVLRYEASIGRNGTRLEELKGEELEQYAAECRKYLRFGEEVEDCLAGRLEQTTAVWVRNVPDLLKEAGCGDMDLYITQKHLRNILHNSSENISQNHYHNIELRQLKQLPELLSEPVAILSTKEHPGTMTVVLDAQDRQKNPLIVPIKMNGAAFYRKSRVEANCILSVYGKENIIRYMEKAFNENGILFLDKNKSIGSGRKPLHLRQFLNTNASINKIQQPEENVNALDEIFPEISKEFLEKYKEEGKEMPRESNEFPRKGL